MNQGGQWVQWVIELQSLAQAGLTYGADVYDRERYTRIREISAEMMAGLSQLPLEKVTDLFCSETGYQTPKLDTRAAVFNGESILLVQENDGRWSLPGGWCDVNVSVGENTVKEVKEEAGLDVVPERIIAIQDRSKHNRPLYAYGICKVFIQCAARGGSLSRTLKQSSAAISPRTACRLWQRKRPPRHRSKCALTRTTAAIGRFYLIREGLIQSARAIREGFFVTTRRDFAGIIGLLQEITTQLWRKRPAKRRKRFNQCFLRLRLKRGVIIPCCISQTRGQLSSAAS